MIGYFALFGWPVIAAIFFSRFVVPVAVAATVVGGYLLLPEEPVINLPGLPRLDKYSIPCLAAIVLASVAAFRLSKTGQDRDGAAFHMQPGWLPRVKWVLLIFAILIIGAFATVYLNQSGYVVGERSMPGLRPYDAFSIIMITGTMLLPLLLGRKFLAHPRAHLMLLVVLGVAGLLYSLPALWEVRMSPQLNKQIYGFFPHDWRQHKRDGGFRPIVFLHHGLWLAIFLCCAGIAAAALSRLADQKYRTFWLIGAFWLLGTIVLSKNLGALLLLMAIGAAVLFLSTRLQLLLAACIAGLVLTYPMLRGADLFPVDRVVSVIERIDDRRAGSLAFRFDNEDILLEKAREKVLFGWGGWGRARVFDHRGRDISVTDGYWVITMGEGGWVRYLSEFGLLALPLILLARRRREYEVDRATAGLCLVLAANLLDAIPNAGLTTVSWLIAGALIGRLEMGLVTKTAEGAEAASGNGQRPPGARSRSELPLPGPVLTRQKERFPPARRAHG